MLLLGSMIHTECATGPYREQASRPLDFVATYSEAGDVIRAVAEALADFAAEERTPEAQASRQRLLAHMSSRRPRLDQAADTAFRGALARVERDGHSFDIKPVYGDRFPVRALYFRDGTFLLVDTVDQTHLLCLCRAGEAVLLATGTQSPWRPSIRTHRDLEPTLVRVFAFAGFVSPDRGTALTMEQLSGCLAGFADRTKPVRRRFGDQEREHIQAVHDFFFQIDRRDAPRGTRDVLHNARKRGEVYRGQEQRLQRAAGDQANTGASDCLRLRVAFSEVEAVTYRRETRRCSATALLAAARRDPVVSSSASSSPGPQPSP